MKVITELLRTTPVGMKVNIGGRAYLVKRFNASQTVKTMVCMPCVFSNGDGAKFCPYACACLAHLRPDRNAVYFTHTEMNE